MSRRQLIGFVAAFAVIAGGLVWRHEGSRQASPLRGLIHAAALQPCPAGLGPELPRITLPCLGGGKAVALTGATPGRPTLVNIWGSWCHPCTAEVPDLVSFAAKAAGRVAVVGVDTEDDRADALRFAAQQGMHYPSLVDDDKRVLLRYGSGPPVTLFLDAAGHVVHVQRGQFHSVAEIERLVGQHLGVAL